MVQNVFGAALLGTGLAVLAAGLWVVHWGRTWHAAVQRLDDPAGTTVDALEPGPVALTGTVRPADDTSPVTGPMSDREGVVSESQVTTGRYRLRISDRQADWTPFELDDGTGRVRVELPEDLSVRKPGFQAGRFRARWFWGLSWDLVEEVRAGPSWGASDPDAVRELDAPFDLRFGPDDLPPGQVRTYRERVVRPGDEIYVMGEATRTAGWDGPDWTVTADDYEGFLLSDELATREGRADVRRTRTWSSRIGYGMGAVALVFGLAVSALGASVSSDPLRALLYLLVAAPVLGAGVAVARGGYGRLPSVDFEWRSLAAGAGLGLALAGGGGYLLASRAGGTGALVTPDAWPAYVLLAAGAFLLWGAVSAFLYVQYGIDLPMRGTIPGEE